MRNVSRKEFLSFALVGGVSVAAIASGCARTGESSGSDASEAGVADAAQRGFDSALEGSGYGSRLFDDSFVHAVDIRLANEDWCHLQEYPLKKEKFEAEVSIDGEDFTGLKVSAKGSNSLRRMAKGQTGRYSLKLAFSMDTPSEGYYGLDEISLGNGSSDPSLAKDFLAYKMFREMGVPGPLSSYAWVTVNDEPYGLFVVSEILKKGFLNRNFSGQGMLYKPEPAELTAINKQSAERIEQAIETGEGVPEDNGNPSDLLDPYTNGADLRYTGDDLANYADIFADEIFDATEEDKRRVVAALKALSEGRSADALDEEEVISYFAVHNFASSYDSYTGIFSHNYYLYENEGKLALLPWDYDFDDSLCTNARALKGEHLTEHHEDADIDAPLTVPEDSRPLWTWIPDSEDSLERYHEYVDAFLTKCVESLWAAQEIDRVSQMIREYVEVDPTAVYSLNEFDEAVADLQDYCQLRAEHIRAQLG